MKHKPRAKQPIMLLELTAANNQLRVWKLINLIVITELSIIFETFNSKSLQLIWLVLEQRHTTVPAPVHLPVRTAAYDAFGSCTFPSAAYI
jgi:hypothetical protein